MSRTRRLFTPSQKAEIVRRHLKDQVPVSELATEHNLQPGRIHQWIEPGLTQLERAFEKPGRKPRRSAGKLEQLKDQKIHRLEEKPALKNEVISGLLVDRRRGKESLHRFSSSQSARRLPATYIHDARCGCCRHQPSTAYRVLIPESRRDVLLPDFGARRLESFHRVPGYSREDGRERCGNGFAKGA